MKGFWFNAVAVFFGCFVFLIWAMASAEATESEPPRSCTNVGCVWDAPNQACAGSCTPSNKCDCEQNPFWDENEPEKEARCFCKWTAP
jgi:hypothetical protein